MTSTPDTVQTDQPMRRERPMQAQSAPLRIIWLADGCGYVATEPRESTMSKVVDDGGKLFHVQQPSVMTSCALRRATPEEIVEWRIRP